MADNLTGTLKNWVLMGGVLIGEIHSDARKKFPDGTTVRTSTVKLIGRNDQGEIIATTRNSTYLLA